MGVKIVIPRNVYIKTMYWIDKSDKEISGLGKVRVDKEKGEITILDSYLFPQENGPTETELSAEGLALGMSKLINEPGELRWWWHSHVNMGVFWSGTDHATMKQLGKHGWFLSTVFNKKREKKSAFYAKEGNVLPWGSSEVFIDDIETNIIDFIDPKLFEEWDKAYTDNVKEKSYVTMYSGNNANPINPISSTIGKTGGTTTSKKMRRRMRKIASKNFNPHDDRFSADEYQRLIMCSFTEKDIDMLSWLSEMTVDEICELAEKGSTPEQICQINYARWSEYERYGWGI